MFGDRLKLARKKAGYSLRGLSDALDGHVTAQALGKYERDALMPSSGVLIRLAKILGVSLEYLLSEQVEELEAVEFRKRSGTLVGERARVEAEVTDCLQRYLTIEEILGLDSGVWRTPQCANRFLNREDEGETAAENMRKEWLEGRGEEGQHEVPRRFERLCYWALAEGLISPSKASELLQQPRNRIEQGLRGPAEIDADYRKCQRKLTCAPSPHV